MKTSKQIRLLVQGAVIAALYTALTYAAAAMNLAYHGVQFRFSEALTVLPVFTPAAIPGLTLGCFLSNLASPLGVVDWIFGPLATLLGALATRAVSRIKWKGVPILAPLPPVLCNTVIVGLELACLSETTGAFAWGNFSWAVFGSMALSVGLGELAVCYALGLPLIIALQKLRAQDTIFAV